MDKFKRCLPYILEVEGGYSDHPEDTGGETNYGITQRVYQHYINLQDEPGDWPPFKHITYGIVRDIYKKLYWDDVRGDDLPEGIDLMVFDSAVHAGPYRARTWLQEALNAGLQIDGVIGPITMGVIGTLTPTGRLRLLERIALYRMLLAEGNRTFTKGWFTRILRILVESARMV